MVLSLRHLMQCALLASLVKYSDLVDSCLTHVWVLLHQTLLKQLRMQKAGQVRYRTDKNGIVHGGVGKVGFEPLAIKENIEALIGDLKKGKPASAKGAYIKKIVLSTTMGAGIPIDQSTLEL